MTDTKNDFDILVIGGGINGAGIARDAVGRGYSVCLVEQADLGGATSAWSTKLIHGGLRYLEHYEFRLVREALADPSCGGNPIPLTAENLRSLLLELL